LRELQHNHNKQDIDPVHIPHVLWSDETGLSCGLRLHFRAPRVSELARAVPNHAIAERDECSVLQAVELPELWDVPVVAVV
jgi:hypothetical protein